jgi:hypothetical protein
LLAEARARRQDAGAVTVGVPDPASVDIDRVRQELPHGDVTVTPVPGDLRVPGSDTLIACASITVSLEYPDGTG